MKTVMYRRSLCSLATVFLIQVLFLSALVEAEDVEDEGTVIDINAESWQKAHNERRKLLLLIYKTEGCSSCAPALKKFNTILGQPEIPSGVELGKSADAMLMANLGVRSVPALVFLREGTYVIYDGQIEVESMLEWIPLASNVAMQELGDDSFEHLTQASTGATTGDWLVNFYKPGCKDVTPVCETIGVRYRGRVNVAKVNTAENPKLQERFQIKGCPHIIYFRQGKMYRFDLPTLDVASLRSFLDGFYKNSKAENVPIPKSSFDYVTEGIADFLKEQLEGENRTLVLAGVCGVALSFLFIIFLCCRSALEVPPKEKDE